MQREKCQYQQQINKEKQEANICVYLNHCLVFPFWSLSINRDETRGASAIRFE